MRDKGNYFKSYKQQVAYLHDQRSKKQEKVCLLKNGGFNGQQVQQSDGLKTPRSLVNNSEFDCPIDKGFKKDYDGIRPLTSRACQTDRKQVWGTLYQNGLRSKKQIEKAYKLKQLEIDVECTLQPVICKNNRFYTPKNISFVERSYAWQENKIEKIVKEKQIQIVKGLSQCTFQPKLFNKKNISFRNQKGEGKSKTPSKIGRKSEKQKMKENEEKDEKNTGLIRQGVGVMKNLIRQELNRLNLF